MHGGPFTWSHLCVLNVHVSFYVRLVSRVFGACVCQCVYGSCVCLRRMPLCPRLVWISARLMWMRPLFLSMYLTMPVNHSILYHRLGYVGKFKCVYVFVWAWGGCAIYIYLATSLVVLEEFKVLLRAMHVWSTGIEQHTTCINTSLFHQNLQSAPIFISIFISSESWENT